MSAAEAICFEKRKSEDLLDVSARDKCAALLHNTAVTTFVVTAFFCIKLYMFW